MDSKLQKHWDCEFGTEYCFVGFFSSCVVVARIVSRSEFWCHGSAIVSSVVQEVPLVAGNVFILGLSFAISPRRVSCLGSQGGSQFFSPVNEVGIDEGSASVVYNGLRNFKKKRSISQKQI